MMHRRASSFVLLLLGLAAGSAAAQTPLPVDTAVRTGTLENGLRYYVRHNPRPEKRAELRLVVNAGSVLEDSTQQGLAHFVEHMAFNGTKNFPKQELVSYLESIGMRFGADLNAYTSFDETVYMLQVPTDTGRALARGIEILEDWAHGQAFERAEIEKERGVVIEEWRLGQGAEERMRREYFPVLLRGSRYVERLPIGDTAVLAQFAPEVLERFYRDWYRPDLMAVVAVGDFDVAEVEGMIRARFGALRNPATPRPRTAFPIPDHAETLVSIATDPEATNTVVQAFYKRAAEPEGTLEAYRRGLLESLHNSMLNTRLGELTQKANPPFINASAGFGGLLRGKSAFMLGAAVQEGGVVRGLEAVVTEAERVRRHGFTASELEREKTNLLRGYEQAYAEREKSESYEYADEYVRNFLEQESIPGIAYEYALVQRLLPQITLEEVNALARAWVSDSNRVIVVTAPERSGAAAVGERDLLAVFDAVRAAQLEPYADDVASAPLVATTPAPGRITSEQQHADLGVTEWLLSNGARVLLKPTDFKDDEVLFGARSPGGASLLPDSLYYSAMLVPALAGVSGLGSFDAIQLRKQLTGTTAQVGPAVNDLEEGLAGMTSPKDLDTLFQLIYLHFTGQRSDSIAFPAYLQRLNAVLANRDRDPETAFADTLTVTLAQHHFRAQPVTQQVVSQITRERVARVFRDRIQDASDFTFVFAGAFTVEQLRPLVLQWLGSLPSMNRREQPRDAGVRPPRGVVERTVRRGVEPKSQTEIVFTGETPYSLEARYLIGSLAEVLDIRLRDVLREDLGGTYGVGVSGSLQRVPVQSYRFSIEFGAAPDRLESLAQEVFRQIEALQRDGIAADLVERVKEQQRRTLETSSRTNAYWLGHLLRSTQTGDPLNAFLGTAAYIERLTPAKLQEAARRWLDPKHHVRVSLYPEK